MDRWRKWIASLIVAAHIALIAAYSFPDRLVPEDVRVMARSYVRPLFHQQWELFAPDPPLCSCEIEWSSDRIEWRSMPEGNYLTDRIKQNLARYAQPALRSGDEVDPLLIEAMRKITGMEEEVFFRSREECVIDAEAPEDREIRITPIGP